MNRYPLSPRRISFITTTMVVALFAGFGCVPASEPPTGEPLGSFKENCKFSHSAQVDPIVSPGGMSHHMHDFFGNTSTGASSTFFSLLAASTTCSSSGDKAAYWAPALVGPGGSFVTPARAIIYYRNPPDGYGTTMPFPPDLRLIAGGHDESHNAYWTCEADGIHSDTIPNCPGSEIRAHVDFPSCWDGSHTDSPDHRSHMAYAVDSDGDGRLDRCPDLHPVKVPQINFQVTYPVSDGTGHQLADGTVHPHADFWNAWVSSTLEGLVNTCLRGGTSCGLVT